MEAGWGTQLNSTVADGQTESEVLGSFHSNPGPDKARLD